MYSSIDKPTHEDWVKESDRLIDIFEYHYIHYIGQIHKCQEEGNDFMLKFYCLNLLEVNKKLEMGQVELSKQ